MAKADNDVKIDLWKNKLLDMGKRNKLLNYKETKRGTLRFLEIYTLWQSMVIDEKPIIFPYVDEMVQERMAEGDKLSKEDGAETSRSKISNGIITNLPVLEQQRTLKNIRTRSRQIMEEQGVNALYLSFGFLRWTENDHKQQKYDAPLILVPVTLTWESITSPFILNLHEDEIVVNPTLAYKLQNDFGIELPQYNTDIPLKEYLDSVEKLVNSNHWCIIREVSLGILSFMKINMYQDLEKHRKAILQNPIIQAIVGDPSGIIHDFSDIDECDHDRKRPDQVFQIVDADSSQQDAIICAKKGVSFVLQGPPGTGKSQTITNIIAECLADGKKVLFVSEKMAALDVVYSRLAAANLDVFCLVLHSCKANKKKILNQFDEVLQLAQKKASISQEIYQKLDRLYECRKQLNNYVGQLHTIIEPLHKSIYEVNSILADVQDSEEIIFSIPDVRNTTQEQYNEYLSVLRRLADTVNKMQSDYHTNPWRGVKISFVSNELRHNIRYHLKELIVLAENLNQVFQQVCTKLPFKIANNYLGARKLLKILAVSGERPGISMALLEYNDYSSLFKVISICEKIKKKYLSKRLEIQEMIKKIQKSEHSVGLSKYPSLSDVEMLHDLATQIENIIIDNECYRIWNSGASFNHIRPVYDEAKVRAGRYHSMQAEIAEEFEKEIFTIPFHDIYFRFKTDSASIFKYLKRQYNKDKKLIQSMCLLPERIGDQKIVDVLSKLRDMQEQREWLDEHSSELIEVMPGYYQGKDTDFVGVERHYAAYRLLGQTLEQINELLQVYKEYEDQETKLYPYLKDLYMGIETDWKTVRKSLQWVIDFKKKLGRLFSSNKVFLTKLCGSDDYIKECRISAIKIKQALEKFNKYFAGFINLFEDYTIFVKSDFSTLINHFNDCNNHLAELEEWIDYRNIKSLCDELQLGEFIEKMEKANVQSSDIISTFNKRFFYLWLDSVLPEFPAVANFRGKMQDDTIKEFCHLDKLQLDIAKSRIRYQLINGLPSLNHFTNGVDEISILKRELGKKRKIMPLRKLFQKIPNLIMTLKPCLMMSPLSVSLFLESESYVFDTVIFDEASQVCTENAIGAIFRGKQVIIAGDSKQLPPTNFFKAATADSNFDSDGEIIEDMVNDDYESILDEAALLPERTLMWHYRSRHEHLISFSNAKIYNNKLITFPSIIEKEQDIGVEYIYLKNGFYDRGGRKGNVVEAGKVAEMVFEHYQKFPDRSLGVITFGVVQQMAIDEALQKMRIENPDFEEFFKEERPEPFFVKSLENVQGDERDTIIFSIGYAKDSSGVMRLNFGPLSMAGGERRLNVAITRAKYNIKLVGSILPGDISVSRTSMYGPKLLRSYIEFAMNGPMALELEENLEKDVVQEKLIFENMVSRFLEQEGYKIATQVGCSDYRIDIAVKHPLFENRYVIGIECDGMSYYSARTARERDRLRHDVLESMGWRLYRIWSTDWVKDSVSEGQKLINAIQSAMEDCQNKETGVLQYQSDEEENKIREVFLMEETKVVSSKNILNPYHFDPMPPINLSALAGNNQEIDMRDCVEQVIMKMYPIHFDIICHIAAPLLGREKVTSKVKDSVENTLYSLKGQCVERNQFYFPKKCKNDTFWKVPVRQAGKRSIKYISNEELAGGMLRVASVCIGITKEGLISETIRAFGFNRSGINIVSAMNKTYEMLIRRGYIEIINNKISIIKENSQ